MPTTRAPGPGEPIVEVRDLSKQYETGDRTVQAVDDVSFTVDRGSIVGLLGPNGAGKTTTIKSVLGLVVPTNGTIAIAGDDVSERPGAVYSVVSALFEGARNLYWRLTVRENVRLFARMHGNQVGDDRIDELVETVGLVGDDGTQVRRLSRGMKQKAAIACVLAKDTPIVFLDEPTLGLDVQTGISLAAELTRLASEFDKTVIVSSHDMGLVQSVCDRVLVMRDGSLIADDSVANLVDAFSTTAYRVTVAELPADRRPADLLDAGQLLGCEVFDESDTATLTVQLSGKTEFYDVVEQLRASGVVVEAIETVQPDLEDVFLRLVEDERGAAVVA